MFVVRCAPLKKMHMFSEVLEFLRNSCTKVCKADQVDFIVDSYIENSIKEGERQWRSAVGAPLQFVRLEKTTPIPVQCFLMFPVKVMIVFPAVLCSVTLFTCRLDGCDAFFSSNIQCSFCFSHVDGFAIFTV